jgi:hypothetical protein
MKLTAKLLKNLIQEELQEKIELGNFKNRVEAAKKKLEKIYGIKPESEDDLNKILQIMDDKIMSYDDFSQQGDPSMYNAYYNDAFSRLPGAQAYDKVKGHLKTALQEDGHQDVSSARRKLKTTIEDASEILQSLESMPEQELPSWWMSKVTIVSEYINKARDYLLVDGDTMNEVEHDDKEPEALQKDAELVNIGRILWTKAGLSDRLSKSPFSPGKEVSYDEYIKGWDEEDLKRFIARMQAKQK